MFRSEEVDIPEDMFKKELKIAVEGIRKKIIKVMSGKMKIDKLNLFMAQNNRIISKVYNFAIRRQYMSVTHQSFEDKWNTVFKWEDKVSNRKVKI